MVSSKAARQQIDDRLRRLRSERYEDLENLPPITIDDVPFGAEIWSLTTYRHLEKHAVRIVVQIGPPQPKFFLVRVDADGFRLARDGSISPLSDQELAEFK